MLTAKTRPTRIVSFETIELRILLNATAMVIALEVFLKVYEPDGNSSVISRLSSFASGGFSMYASGSGS